MLAALGLEHKRSPPITPRSHPAFIAEVAARGASASPLPEAPDRRPRGMPVHTHDPRRLPTRAPDLYGVDMEGPSIAAIVVPWDLPAARQRVAAALTASGLVRRDTPLPRGYKAAPGEYVGLAYHPLPPLQLGRQSHPNTALVSVDIARIFHLALTISTGLPDDVLVAWRRFAGFEPCAKVIWGGRPRWREGEDHDHEVTWVVPRALPAEQRPPGEIRVPTSLDALSSVLVKVVSPLKDAHAAGGEGWLKRTSPVA